MPCVGRTSSLVPSTLSEKWKLFNAKEGGSYKRTNIYCSFWFCTTLCCVPTRSCCLMLGYFVKTFSYSMFSLG